MEPLKELNKICQKKNYKTIGNWMARNITRDMALPVSWLLLHTPITANQVTTIASLIGVAASIFFGFGGKWYFFTGALMLQLWYLLDHVDGQIARYRRQSSVTGIFLDYYAHHAVHMAVFLGMGVGIFYTEGNLLYLVYGLVSAFLVIFLNIIYDSQYKAYIAWVGINDKVSLTTDSLQPSEVGSHPKSNRKKQQGIAKAVFSYLHKSIEIHVVMNTITLAAIINLFAEGNWPFKFILIFYTCTIPVVTLSRFFYRILHAVPDKQFTSFAEIFHSKIVKRR